MQRESPQGMIQSSIYIYMVLHLLQVRGVLPCLQQLWKTAQGEPPQVYVANCQVYFFNDLSQLNLYWRCANTETLGELVVSFFKYYSADFPYVHGALSVRMRSIIPKDAKGWTKEVSFYVLSRRDSMVSFKTQRQHQMNKAGIKDRYWFCGNDFLWRISIDVGKCSYFWWLKVEHPFDLSYNVAKTMDKETLFKLRGEFIRASKIICGGSFGDGPVLQDILSPQHSTPTSLKFSPTHMNPHFWWSIIHLAYQWFLISYSSHQVSSDLFSILLSPFLQVSSVIIFSSLLRYLLVVISF